MAIRPAATSVIMSRISPSDSHRRAHSWTSSRPDLRPDALVVLILEKERANNDGYERNHDWKRQAGVDVSGARDQAGRDDGEEPAEPTVAEMVRKGHRGVPDPGRKSLDQKCRDRAVDHRHEYDLDEHQRR